MEMNEGLKSRIPYWIEFPDYTTDELTDIFKMMIEERGFHVANDVIKRPIIFFDKARNNDNFGNGRYVRNFIEHAIGSRQPGFLVKKEDASKIQSEELFFDYKR